MVELLMERFKCLFDLRKVLNPAGLFGHRACNRDSDAEGMASNSLSAQQFIGSRNAEKFVCLQAEPPFRML